MVSWDFLKLSISTRELERIWKESTGWFINDQVETRRWRPKDAAFWSLDVIRVSVTRWPEPSTRWISPSSPHVWTVTVLGANHCDASASMCSLLTSRVRSKWTWRWKQLKNVFRRWGCGHWWITPVSASMATPSGSLSNIIKRYLYISIFQWPFSFRFS